MKWLIRVCAGLLVAFALGGVALPNHYQVVQQIEINADKAEIYPWIADLKRWPQWTSWHNNNPKLQIVLGDPSFGDDAYQRWVDEQGREKGNLIFNTAHPDHGVSYTMSVGDNYATGDIALRTLKNRVTVIRWQMKGEFDRFLIGPYMALFSRYFIDHNFKKGLTRLKTAIESNNV
ncbi:SRPBCC family protein [Paraferrimonas haliotis]|uniref:Polyketide cyclase / dehydrase and lipid transport n=1 Tax=Paraferrimonas haliotis TaxID=2013866 RepID=A0AA37WYJ1_9GAMM|nr:SRPBCC family protein [Paraferrimonas haliotis]GLS83181.1 hypothetical protein GCM10007894_11580 [Paraferrimonas haliotis]